MLSSTNLETLGQEIHSTLHRLWKNTWAGNAFYTSPFVEKKSARKSGERPASTVQGCSAADSLGPQEQRSVFLLSNDRGSIYRKSLRRRPYAGDLKARDDGLN